MITYERGRHNIDLSSLGLKKEQILILSIAGSRMYGTATENSDFDYIGVYIPTKYDIYTNNVQHHHSIKTDIIDLQIWSIYKFMTLVCQGETLAIDLLHSSYFHWIMYTNEWIDFQKNKSCFYTKKMKTYIDYSRDQAIKYGIKGENFNTLQIIIDFLENCGSDDMKLYEQWNELPNDVPHVYKLNTKPYRMYQVCGKKYQETVKIGYIKDGIKNLLNAYGKRAILAAKNRGIDWKGLSHAIRAVHQVHDILTTGNYQYPLKNYKFIKQVKEGKIDFEIVKAVLSDWMSIVDKLIEKSNYPENIDTEKWQKWLYNFIERNAL